MTNEFRVSVIIPVYNARAYLAKAVESAANLSEVAEVILVEDGSPDNALDVCRNLSAQFPKVKVFQHPGGINRGAGASRNLGIEKSSYPFLAFLDADDWYLPNRFEKESELFKDKSIDGVYGATGHYYQDEDRFEASQLTTVNENIEPKRLLNTLLKSHTGRFHTDAITVRKSLLAKTGVFDTSLRLHQDTHLWLRMAFFGTLVPGFIDKAVSVRRVHGGNRISGKNAHSRHLLYKKLFESFNQYSGVSKEDFRLILKRYVGTYSEKRLHQVFMLVRLLVHQPSLINKIL